MPPILDKKIEVTVGIKKANDGMTYKIIPPYPIDKHFPKMWKSYLFISNSSIDDIKSQHKQSNINDYALRLLFGRATTVIERRFIINFQEFK